MTSFIKGFVYFFFGALAAFIGSFFTKDIIILQTYSKNRYAGSPRYLFEYLSDNTEYNVYWVTSSEQIKNYLDENKYSYLPSNIFKKIMIILKTKIVVDSGTGYFNWMNLIGNDVVKICTQHGLGPKIALWKTNDLEENIKILRVYNEFDYVGFTTCYSKRVIGKEQFLLPDEKMKTIGAPKDDILFNTSYVEFNRKRRPVLSGLKINRKSKVIFYAPTYRQYEATDPLVDIECFDYKELMEFLVREDIYILASYHSLSDFSKLLKKSDRIIYLNTYDYPLLDNNQLLVEIDMFMGDYSTLSTNFSILEMPQLFLVADYEKYREVRGVGEDMEQYFAGPKICSMNDLLSNIKKYLGNKKQYVSDYKEEIDLLQKRYAGSITNSCEKYKNLIDDVFQV